SSATASTRLALCLRSQESGLHGLYRGLLVRTGTGNTLGLRLRMRTSTEDYEEQTHGNSSHALPFSRHSPDGRGEGPCRTVRSPSTLEPRALTSNFHFSVLGRGTPRR